MKPKKSFIYLVIFVFLFLLPIQKVEAQNQYNYGLFNVELLPGWTYDAANTNETYLTFKYHKNDELNHIVRLKQTPIDCPTKKVFNKTVYRFIIEQRKLANYVDKAPTKSDYSALGHQNCHMMTYIAKKFNHRAFVLSPIIDGKMYNIYIFDKVSQKKKIRQEALDFIAGISLNNDQELLAEFEETRKIEKENQDKKPEVNSQKKNNEEAKQTEENTSENMEAEGSSSEPSGKITQLPKLDISSMADIPASNPIPFVDINTISQSEWDGAVSAAMEGMRLVYGPMSELQEKDFDKSWAPLRQTPFEEAIDYLNKFNPLLGEFLSYRTSITQTSILMEEAFKNAGYAADYDDPELSFNYLALGAKYQNLLVSRQKRLQQVSNELVQLGNPPNGAQLMAQHQRKYKKEKDYLKTLVNKHIPEGCWAGYSFEWWHKKTMGTVIYDPAFVYVFKIDRYGEEKYYGIRLEPNTKLVNNSISNVSNFQMSHDAVQMLESPKYTANLIDFEGNRTSQLAINLEKFEYPNIPRNNETSDSHYTSMYNLANEKAKQATQKDNTIGSQIVAESFSDAAKDIQEMMRCKTFANQFYKTAQKWTEDEKWQDFDYSYHEFVLSDEILLAFSNAMQGDGDEILTQKASDNSKSQNTNKKEEEELTDNSDSKENLLHFIEDKTKEERQKIDAETIEFHNSNLAIIQKNMERDRKELNDERDPQRKKDLQMRILGARANIQAEKDRIATIKTGVIVHNRSPWDNYAKSNFIQNIAKDQRKMENISRGIRKAYEMADKLPPVEARKVRKIINDKYNGQILAKMDEKAARDIINEANAVGKKYFRGKMDEALAENEEAIAEAEWAETCLYTAEVVKSTADYSMMGLSLFGGQYVNNAYQGITGYIEGGPKEAFLRVAGTYNTLTGVAVDGYRGFEAAVDKGGGITEGLYGAGWEAAKGFITEKAMQFGLGKISKSFNRPNGDVDVEIGSKPKVNLETDVPKSTRSRSSKPKITEPDFNRPLTNQEIEVHRQQIADGRAKVNSYKKTYKKLQDARKAGAPPSEVKKILVELDDRSTKIHSSPQAKVMMKTLQKHPKNLDMVKRYSNSMERVHIRVEKRYKADMQQKGWEPEELTPIRNKPDPADLQRAREMQARGEKVPPEQLLGSKTVNMDYDAGRKPKLDANGNPIPPIKNGEPAPLEAWHGEAQSSWEKSYLAETGQSPTHSWENITHGKMGDAYADLNVLEKNGILKANKDWAGQTSDVSYYKAEHIRSSPEFQRVEKYVEIARGTSKDCGTKMMPLFDQKKPKAGTPSYKAWEGHKKYWTDINNTLKDMGSGKTDPLKADRQIRKMTGGKSVLEVTHDMRNFMESLMILGNN